MDISAMNVQSQIQTTLLAKTMSATETSVLSLLASMEQTQQAVEQSMGQLSATSVDIVV